MLKIFLVILGTTIFSIYANFGINTWQVLTANMKEIKDNFKFSLTHITKEIKE